ncbi:VIT1/CCC1 transporter family protein, partial [Pseudomonas syringae]|uniref:VIT1/CCC1 transporter family protein n=1 Tax=Pseudomonas syringae TaxID=317 RepID=UPI0034D95EA5
IYSHTMRVLALIIVTTIALALFGGVGAYLGGSPIRVSAMRVLIGGWVSMAISYGLLKPFSRKHGEESKTPLVD